MKKILNVSFLLLTLITTNIFSAEQKTAKVFATITNSTDTNFELFENSKKIADIQSGKIKHNIKISNDAILDKGKKIGATKSPLKLVDTNNNEHYLQIQIDKNAKGDNTNFNVILVNKELDALTGILLHSFPTNGGLVLEINLKGKDLKDSVIDYTATES